MASVLVDRALLGSPVSPVARGPRVLHVLEPVDGGVPEWVRLVAAAQRSAGIDSTIAGPIRIDAHPSFRQMTIDRSSPLALARSIGQVRELARDFDVVHLHSFFAGLAGRTTSLGVPTVFHPHGWVHQMEGRGSQVAGAAIERRLAGRTDAIATVNHEESELGAEAGVSARFHEVGVPVDLDRFATLPTRDSARRDLGVRGPIAVCVGRLCAQKGQRPLIDLWPAMTEGAATLVLVGPAQDGFDLPSSLPDSVIHTGPADPAPWLAAADVVVQPSHWEGQSIAVGEALAASRPVVAFDVTGMRRAILDGHRPTAGAVVPKGAYELLIHETTRRLTQPLLRTREGNAGADRAFDLFSPTAIAQRLDDLYEDLLP